MVKHSGLLDRVIDRRSGQLSRDIRGAAAGRITEDLDARHAAAFDFDPELGTSERGGKSPKERVVVVAGERTNVEAGPGERAKRFREGDGDAHLVQPDLDLALQSWRQRSGVVDRGDDGAGPAATDEV